MPFRALQLRFVSCRAVPCRAVPERAEWFCIDARVVLLVQFAGFDLYDPGTFPPALTMDKDSRSQLSSSSF